jgi:hypothetical protein
LMSSKKIPYMVGCILTGVEFLSDPG